jgi:ABC-type branched-subunit amino acid transport system substrate-binding protein
MVALRWLRFSLFGMLAGVALLAGGRPASPSAAAGSIRVGTVFPLRGAMAPLAREEYLGVEIARDLVNADGGVSGRSIVLDTRELDMPDESQPMMNALQRSGIRVVLGAYSSALSIPASAAAANDGMVYWEAGAVADRLTGRGLPTVFRVGASGSNLGSNSARFAALQLAPRLHKARRTIRISIVFAADDYAQSVADAAVKEAGTWSMRVVSQTRYDDYAPDWPLVLQQVKRAHPDILILASHILDGVAFRRAELAAHLHVGAFIGSTMAQCVPEFGALLGRDAVGVFASDRPPGGFNPGALDPQARALYDRLADQWRRRTGQPRPSEEGLAGFTAAWALFHDVLPRAASRGSLTPSNVSAAARTIDLPTGALPNGAGLRFATDAPHRGQNLRAAAVIWQWQAVRHSVVVWPAEYATGRIRMVPLPR